MLIPLLREDIPKGTIGDIPSSSVPNIFHGAHAESSCLVESPQAFLYLLRRGFKIRLTRSFRAAVALPSVKKMHGVFQYSLQGEKYILRPPGP
jgi:hypothetical protein